MTASIVTFDSSDFRDVLFRFTPEARKANQALIEPLARIGERKKATPAQIALGWVACPEAVDRSDPSHHEAGTA